ncbi:hypothetical protein ACWEKJ_01215 [Amycolatopsis thermoflava]
MPTAVSLFALDWAADLNQAIRQATDLSGADEWTKVHLTQGVVIALAPERPHARRADEVDPGRGPDRGHEACHAG